LENLARRVLQHLKPFVGVRVSSKSGKV
jgi:hypothetical protein